MLKVLFLGVFVFCSVTVAQVSEKAKSIKIDELGISNSEEIGARMDNYFIELKNNPNAQGYIINYGKDEAIARRISQIKQTIFNYKKDARSLMFIKGGYKNETKTEFWIMPSDAEKPEIEPTAYKFGEFNNLLNEKNWKLKLDRVLQNQNENCENQIYVMIYDKKSNADGLGAKYHNYFINNTNCDSNPNKFVIVSNEYHKKQETELWIVPPGAEPPKS